MNNLYYKNMDLETEIIRKKKKQKIMAVFGFIFLVLAVLVILWFIPDPTCTDGKKNGAETEIDCGGFCAPCQEKISARDVIIQKTDFVSSGKNVYDLVVWLENPNDIYGVKSIEGSFVLFGASGNILKEVPTRSFLLPGEKKYIVSQGVSGVDEMVDRMEWRLTDILWVDVQNILNLRLSIVDRKYQELTSGAGFSQVSGLLKNESDYDWNDVIVSILLFDRSGDLLATHGTSRQTFRSGEKWDFQLIFPERFSGDVYNVEMQAETNIYRNENFLKAQVSGGMFQDR